MRKIVSLARYFRIICSGCYIDFIKKFLLFLKSLKNCQINISFHPGVSSKVKKYFVSKEINIKSEWILNQIPKNDIYLSYYSSLIRWALLAGKFTLNYDLYNLNLQNVYWKKVEMNDRYFYLNSFGDLKKKIQDLLKNFDNLNHSRKFQSKSSSNLGLFDGKCLNRIYDNIYKK